MTPNKLPFPEGIIAFQTMFPDERACEQYLFSMRHPNGFVCETCRATKYYEYLVCWCAPLPCHASVLIKLREERIWEKMLRAAQAWGVEYRDEDIVHFGRTSDEEGWYLQSGETGRYVTFYPTCDSSRYWVIPELAGATNREAFDIIYRHVILSGGGCLDASGTESRLG